MVSLSALPRAPPAALYNPLEHGNSFRRTEDTQVKRDNITSSIVLHYKQWTSFTTLVSGPIRA